MGEKKEEFLLNFTLGGASAIISKTITAPIERVKLILQTMDSHTKFIANPELKYKGMTDCLLQIFKSEGLVALWRSNFINVMSYSPKQAFNFAFRDLYTDFLVLRSNSSENPHTKKIVNMLSGGLAGTTTNIFLFPLEFVRTRLAADIGKSCKDRQFNGFGDCVIKIFNAEGITGLYRGYFITIPLTFVYRSIYFGFYDNGKQSIHKIEKRLPIYFGENTNRRIS